MKISVLGNGRWGSFLAWYSSKIGHEVLIWGREDSRNFYNLMETRKNQYLTLQPEITFTTSLNEAISHADIVIISINSQYLRNLLKEVSKTNFYDKIFTLNMKGLEIDTGKRLTQIAKEELGVNLKVAAWVGPGHVQDFINGVPNCMVVSSDSPDITELVISAFSSKLIRFYSNPDLIGTEIGAALKNVFGIAAGMLDGLSLTSLKGPLIARGPFEASRLIKHLGGNELSAYGLAHLGDYEATIFSRHSHNRTFGESFVTNKQFDYLAEGLSTLQSLNNMNIPEIELPIIESLNDIIIYKMDPLDTLNDLFMRPLKDEFY